MGAGDQAVALAVHGDLAAVGVEALDLDVGQVYAGATADADAEALLPDAGHADPVADATELEVQRVAALVLDLRAAAVRGGEQPLPGDLLLVLVGFDGGRGERDRGVPAGDEPALGADAVDPAGVGAGVDQLRLLQQVEHETLVGGTALDDHGGLAHRAAQPGERLVAVAAVGDDLGDHRVEVGGDGVALAHAGVDADAWARGQQQPRDVAGGGGEVAIRVLGVEPRLHGVPGLDRLRALESAACGDVQLQPH